MESVGVFDFNEGNIGELLIGPCKGDAPFGNPGIGIDGISPGAVQFVVMERMKGQKIFSVRGSAKLLIIGEKRNPKREQDKDFHPLHYADACLIITLIPERSHEDAT
jgi:hypothetical protein